MVDVDDSCQFLADSQPKLVVWLGLRVVGHPALSLHSSDEPGELSQWPWSWWQHHKHCHGYYYYFFWPSVDMFPREFKNWDIQNWVQNYQSVQSGVGKLSCNKTALKRCTSTETLWKRKAPSLSSPEHEEIFLPKLPKSCLLYTSPSPRD